MYNQYKSTTSDQITPFDSDEQDSSSKDASDTTGTLANQSTKYITLQTSNTPDSSSDEEENHQLESELSSPSPSPSSYPQPETLVNDTNTLVDNASLLSSNEHSSTSSNAGDVSTTEDITDNEEQQQIVKRVMINLQVKVIHKVRRLLSSVILISSSSY